MDRKMWISMFRNVETLTPVEVQAKLLDATTTEGVRLYQQALGEQFRAAVLQRITDYREGFAERDGGDDRTAAYWDSGVLDVIDDLVTSIATAPFALTMIDLRAGE